MDDEEIDRQLLARGIGVAPACPRCGLPVTYPCHDPEWGSCKPMSDLQWRKFRANRRALRRAGTEGAWREWGAHQWQ